MARLAQVLRQNEDLIRPAPAGNGPQLRRLRLRGVLTETHLDVPGCSSAPRDAGHHHGRHAQHCPAPGAAASSYSCSATWKRPCGSPRDSPTSSRPACDLLDRRLLTLAREDDPRFEAMIAKSAEAAALVEQIGYGERRLLDRLKRITDEARHLESTLIIAQQSAREDEVEFLWSLPARVVSLLIKLPDRSARFRCSGRSPSRRRTCMSSSSSARQVLQKYEVTALALRPRRVGTDPPAAVPPDPTARGRGAAHSLVGELARSSSSSMAR